MFGKNLPQHLRLRKGVLSHIPETIPQAGFAGIENQWKPDGKAVLLDSSLQGLGFLPPQSVFHRRFHRVWQMGINEVKQEITNGEDGFLLAELLCACHEGTPLRLTPVFNQTMNVHQPDQSLHSVLQRVKGEVEYLIVWTEATGYLSFYMNGTGLIIDGILASGKEQGARGNPIRPEHMCVDIQVR